MPYIKAAEYRQLLATKAALESANEELDRVEKMDESALQYWRFNRKAERATRQFFQRLANDLWQPHPLFEKLRLASIRTLLTQDSSDARSPQFSPE